MKWLPHARRAGKQKAAERRLYRANENAIA